jgi:Fur family peroxide stress response transcriptional regulator
MFVSEAELEKRMRRFAEKCRQRGMKITHQRTEVFRELAGSGQHPDAETIYQQVRKRVPAISRDTVYRTLSAMEACGLVRKSEILFCRARYDANLDRHHHFVCTECGLVRDFYSKALDALPIPKCVGSLGSILSTHVQVRGTCSACATRKTKAKRRGRTWRFLSACEFKPIRYGSL